MGIASATHRGYFQAVRTCMTTSQRLLNSYSNSLIGNDLRTKWITHRRVRIPFLSSALYPPLLQIFFLLQLLVLPNSKISSKQRLDATAHKMEPAGCCHQRPRPLRASLSPILTTFSALSLLFLTTTQKLDFLKSKSNPSQKCGTHLLGCCESPHVLWCVSNW